MLLRGGQILPNREKITTCIPQVFKDFNDLFPATQSDHDSRPWCIFCHSYFSHFSKLATISHSKQYATSQASKHITYCYAAFAYACNSYGVSAVAAGADIDFLRPVPLGAELVAEAVERARAGRSGLYDVSVRVDGEVVAELRGRARQVPGLPGPGCERPPGVVRSLPGSCAEKSALATVSAHRGQVVAGWSSSRSACRSAVSRWSGP